MVWDPPGWLQQTWLEGHRATKCRKRRNSTIISESSLFDRPKNPGLREPLRDSRLIWCREGLVPRGLHLQFHAPSSAPEFLPSPSYSRFFPLPWLRWREASSADGPSLLSKYRILKEGHGHVGRRRPVGTPESQADATRGDTFCWQTLASFRIFFFN